MEVQWWMQGMKVRQQQHDARRHDSGAILGWASMAVVLVPSGCVHVAGDGMPERKTC